MMESLLLRNQIKAINHYEALQEVSLELWDELDYFACKNGLYEIQKESLTQFEQCVIANLRVIKEASEICEICEKKRIEAQKKYMEAVE